ncbi:hypothetical protein [Roseateles sp.]|uniref:hypothetical protein n=1 Tax=Roseateles sp. TaxID=1971397 RepID=UPI00286BFDE9|nr:hypothetical protein [Roseateles sp.]
MDRCPLKISQSAAAWAKASGARLLLSSAALVTVPAQGFEVGVPHLLSGLGQPLSLQLPVRWAPGEVRAAHCLKMGVVAVVEAGERRLSEGELQQSLLKGADANSALIWLRSKRDIDEPVLILSIGCPAQQLMALVDPVHAMVAPASGGKDLVDPPAVLDTPVLPKQTSRPPRLIKARAERPAAQKNQLRLSSDSLPPLALADAEIPSLRWRFDSDLGGSVASSQAPLKATQEQAFHVRPGAPGASLLMAIDIGRPAGPADLLMAQDGPERLARAQAQFAALQADHRALKLELDKLSADMAARDAQGASTQRWLMAVAGGLVVVLVAAGVYLFKRRRDASPYAPGPASISA